MRAAVPAPVAPAAAGWFPPRLSSALRAACFGEASASKRGGLLARVRPGSGPGPRPALVALVMLLNVFLFTAVLRPAPAPAGPGSGAPAASGVAAAAAGGVEMRRLMPVPVDAMAAEVEVEERVLRQESYDRDQVIDRILSIAAYEAEERPAADGEGAERDADLQPEEPIPAEPAPRTSLTERLAFTATECAAREPELLERVGVMLHDPYMMECARGATAACCAGLQSEASPWHGCTCAAETVWKALQAVPGFVRPLVKTRLTQCGVPLPGAGCPDAAAKEAEVGREGNAAGVQLEGAEAAV